MNNQTDKKARRKRIARGIAFGCLGAVVLAILALTAFYYLLFGSGDTTIYSKAYSETKFQSIRVGMTQKQVLSLLGPPLQTEEKIVFVKQVPQNGYNAGYVYFTNGEQVAGSVLSKARAKGKTVPSIEAALNLLTPQERKLTRTKYRWVYSKPGAPLSQQHKFREVIFDSAKLVIDKLSTEWID